MSKFRAVHKICLQNGSYCFSRISLDGDELSLSSMSFESVPSLSHAQNQKQSAIAIIMRVTYHLMRLTLKLHKEKSEREREIY